MYGSYEALKGGSTSEALEDFTGGLIEHFELAELSREQLLAVLVRGFQMGSFFGCSIDVNAWLLGNKSRAILPVVGKSPKPP